jgi:hypothetical protein
MFKCFVVCKLKKCPQKSTVSTGLMAEHMPLNFNKLMICMPLKPVQGKPLSPKGNYPLLLNMMGICIFPLHCCTLYFRKDCLHVHF